MHKFLVISSVLAVLGLTSCEKGLVDGAIDAGSFFGSGGSGQTSDGTFRLTADPDWDSVSGYTF